MVALCLAVAGLVAGVDVLTRPAGPQASGAGVQRVEASAPAQARPMPEPARSAPDDAAAADPAAPDQPGGAAPAQSAGERTADVEALLAARATAVLTRDRAAFLAGIDPQAPAFATRQAALFDALAEVPLASWSYVVHPADSQPADPALDARYGTWWAPRVVLGVALESIDADPAEADHALTFVRRGARWYVAADDDFAARGDRTTREIWDAGPVAVVRGVSALVLGHPGSLTQMRELATEVDAAVPRVTAVWGTGWSQRVAVVVPSDQSELATLVRTAGSLNPIAALAVAGPVRGGTVRGGDRVLVNPANLGALGALGRRIVLTHEVTHLAARAATGPATPTWLSEGLADHVGYLDTGVPVRAAAGELRDAVRAGRLPAALPAADAWSGDNPELGATYEQAWLAVELLVERYGRDRVLTFYRNLGGRSGLDPQASLEQVLRADLGTDVAQLTADWQAALRRQLG